MIDRIRLHKLLYTEKGRTVLGIAGAAILVFLAINPLLNILGIEGTGNKKNAVGTYNPRTGEVWISEKQNRGFLSPSTQSIKYHEKFHAFQDRLIPNLFLFYKIGYISLLLGIIIGVLTLEFKWFPLGVLLYFLTVGLIEITAHLATFIQFFQLASLLTAFIPYVFIPLVLFTSFGLLVNGTGAWALNNKNLLHPITTFFLKDDELS